MHEGPHPLVDSALLGATHRADCPGCRAYAQAFERLTESINQLQQQVSIDHLTRGANRYAMEEAIVRELQRTQRFGHPASLVICDIDGFKFINDAYGHSVGDRVLKEVSEALSRHCRNTDLVGRWGGDEFAILMPNTTDASAAAVAEKLRAAVRTAQLPFNLRVTASFGVAGAGSSDKWDAWVNRADHAMFEAKRLGRNRVARADAGGEQTEERLPGFLHMTWRPAYCSGHPLLDRQHEALFEVANAVLTVAVAGDLQQATKLFGGLVQECRAHFAEEEQILETAGYPQLEGHAATHRSLLAAAEQMQARLARGEATATELFELIARDLIAGHILKEDRESLGAKLPLSA